MDVAPDDELGITLAFDQLVARSETAAFVLRSIVIYTEGVLATVTIHTRTPSNGRWTTATAGTGGTNLRLALGYPPLDLDTAFAPPLFPITDATTLRHVVVARGGDGDRGRYEITTWISSNNPTDAFTVAVAWPDESIEPTTIDVRLPPPAEQQAKIRKIWPQ
jgi:hypothetical protein